MNEAADDDARAADPHESLDDLRLGRRRLFRVEREPGAEPQIPLRRGGELFDEREVPLVPMSNAAIASNPLRKG